MAEDNTSIQLVVYAAVGVTVSVGCQWHTQLQEEMIASVVQERFK
jgi:hypothetical protein